MARSSRSEIAKCSSRIVSRQHPVVLSPRRSLDTLTPLERRQSNSDNFRDLTYAVRHLTYHICPFENATNAWTWNLLQLRSRWDLFTGRKILGINYDDSTVTPSQIIGYCQSIDMEWDHVIVRENDRRLGEVATWIPSLKCLDPQDACPDEIVFSAHAKGVKYGTDSPPVIRDWTEVMYSVNLDDWDAVRRSLEWFSATGAFRARYRRSAMCRHGWYYSGAFWWWRLADIGQRRWNIVSPWYAGREIWIGNQIEQSEADCLFMDNCRSPYLPQYWKTTINRKWKEFQTNRLENKYAR